MVCYVLVIMMIIMMILIVIGDIYKMMLLVEGLVFVWNWFLMNFVGFLIGFIMMIDVGNYVGIMEIVR